MFLLFVQRDVFAEIHDLAVDAGTHIARLAHLQQLFSVFPLSPTDDRRQDLKLFPFGQGSNGVDHLLHGLCSDLLPTLKAIGMSDAGKEEPEIIVDLRDSPDGRAGIVAGTLLLDGDGRRQAFY